MSIRVKLVLSYIALVAIVVVTVMISTLVIFGYLVGSFFQTLPGIEDEAEFKETFDTFVSQMVDIKYESEHMPDYFMDQAYLARRGAAFNGISIGVGFVKEDQLIYESPEFVPDGIMNILIERDAINNFSGYYHGDSDEPDPHVIELNGDKYYVFGLSTAFDDGSAGALYFIYDITKTDTFGGGFIRAVFFTVFALFLLLIVALLVIIHFMIIKPLKALEYATQQIREGNLEFEIERRSNDEMGKVQEAFNVMRIELKHSIEQQILYEDNRKELISSISHDLKTPITSIKGYVEGILDNVADTEEKKKRYLEVIYTKANSMDQLIDDFFLFSKLDLNRLPFDCISICANTYFNDCFDELAMDVEKRGIDFQYLNGLAGDEEIFVDPMHLKRVILNIVQNAIKYMDKESPVIKMAVEPVKEGIRVSIGDNGIGIKEHELEDIFTRFYRIDKSRNTEVGGSGLGLSISKQIIEHFGGTISATSQFGEGTTITFILKQSDSKKEVSDEQNTNNRR